MTVFLIAYGVLASVLLVWCSTQKNTQYVEISWSLFETWRNGFHNVIVFDLGGSRGLESETERNSDFLAVSVAELFSLLQWIPPKSKVVFYCKQREDLFDAWMEEQLFRANINPIYVLESSIGSPTPPSTLTNA
jgi:hypothetical protein